jgi:GTP-binding protein
MLIRSADYVTSVAHPDRLPMEGLPEIAFAGRSNVGKSSLLNRLLNRRKLANTSKTPGKTRTLNYYLVNETLHFVDLPGYGYAKRGQQERRQWADLINRYLETRTSLRGILHLMDARHDPTAHDVELAVWLLQFGRPFLVVATKADKLPGSRQKSRLDRTRNLLSQLGEFDFVSFSAVSGQGRQAVWRWIRDVIEQ